MPVFEYKCESCGSKYEILHKSKENKDDVLCPSCGSSEPAPSCGMEGCCGGSCGLN